MSGESETIAPLVRIHRAALGYPGAAPVLRGVELAFYPGDFFPILGINGSGKSTFLKTVVGILAPIEGLVEAAETNGRPLRVGYIPQSETLDPIFPLTVREVALMGVYGSLRPGRFLHREHRSLAGSCLEETEVGELAETPFATLSGGQKQRVLLARALAVEPDLLVLDEPTAGIDALGEHKIMELIRRINRERAVAVLMASHNLKMVREFSSRLLWVHDGTVSIEKPENVLPAHGLSL